MKRNHLTLETGLFLSAIAIGFVVRFVGLGSLPLDDREAQLALLAYQLQQGGQIALTGQPAYVIFTRLLFGFFGATEFTARFWPALVGSVLPLAAWLLHEKIGRKAALVLAFFLALDPGLVAVSRQAGSVAIAVSFLMLAFVFAWRGSITGTGIFSGLTLLSGPTVWPGIIALAFATWLYRGWTKQALPVWQALPWRQVLGFGLAAFLIAGSGFLSEPRGLSASALSLVEYIRGWTVSSSVPAPRLVATLFAYSLPTLLLGLIGLIAALRSGDRFGQSLAAWWAASLILALAYPSRTTLDMAWVNLPLLVLAAVRVSGWRAVNRDDNLPVLGQAALSVALLMFILYAMLKIPVAATPDNPVAVEYTIRIVVALLMLFVVTALVGWGWSIPVAWAGLSRGVSVLLAFLWLSALVHAAGMGRHPYAELLRASPQVQSDRLALQTIAEIEQWRPDPRSPISIAVVGLNNPSLVWALRSYPQALFTGGMSPDSQPEIVITSRQDQDLALSSSYRGQELTWSATPAWSLVAPGEWLRWLLFRDMAVESQEAQQIIVWVRSDAFPGGMEKMTVPVTPAINEDLQGE